MKNIWKESELHDSVMNLAASHASLTFNVPIYKVDEHVKELRELCKNGADEDTWRRAIDNSPVYRDLIVRFFGPNNIYNYDAAFVKKIGDIIIAGGQIWSLIEIKTSEFSTNIFNVNAESFLQFVKLPRNQWGNTHFGFYSSVDMSLKFVRLDRFQEIQNAVPICFYEGVNAKVTAEAANNVPFPTTLKDKGKRNPDRPNNESNIFYEFDLNSFPQSSVLDIREYFQRLKDGTLYQQPAFPEPFHVYNGQTATY